MAEKDSGIGDRLGKCPTIDLTLARVARRTVAVVQLTGQAVQD